MISAKINDIDYAISQINTWEKSRCPKVRCNLKLFEV